MALFYGRLTSMPLSGKFGASGFFAPLGFGGSSRPAAGQQWPL